VRRKLTSYERNDVGLVEGTRERERERERERKRERERETLPRV
jgi:hypothetical protein